jgi:energy-coupling factor transporter ATP-binding protein EcfA2
MLISTHDIPMVSELFQRTIVIDGGEIVFDGLTEELLSDAIFLEQHGLEAP